MFQVSTGPLAVTASSTKSLVDLATPAGTGARVAKVWIASDAVSAGTATSSIRVQFGLFSLAVTTHTAVTPDTFDMADNAIASQVTAGINTTAEGAGALVSGRYEEHPLPLTQSELLIWEVKFRYVPVSSFWRLRVITPAGIGTTNLYAGAGWDE